MAGGPSAVSLQSSPAGQPVLSCPIPFSFPSSRPVLSSVLRLPRPCAEQCLCSLLPAPALLRKPPAHCQWSVPADLCCLALLCFFFFPFLLHCFLLLFLFSLLFSHMKSTQNPPYPAELHYPECHTARARRRLGPMAAAPGRGGRCQSAQRGRRRGPQALRPLLLPLLLLRALPPLPPCPP